MATPAKGSMAWVKAQQNTGNIGAAMGLRPVSNASQMLAAQRANAVVATPTATPADTPVDASGGQNGTGQVQYGAATVDNPVPAEPDTSIETLMKTPEYLARERAIQAAMRMFEANQATDKARYEENYGKSLSELGYNPTTSQFDLGELLTSGQQATTSGKAYNALRNDFAARGMLQSGAYQAQQGVLRDQLMKQQQAIEGAKTRFLEDQGAKLTAQQQSNEQQRQAALEAARQSILASWGA